MKSSICVLAFETAACGGNPGEPRGKIKCITMTNLLAAQCTSNGTYTDEKQFFPNVLLSVCVWLGVFGLALSLSAIEGRLFHFLSFLYIKL